MAASTFLFQQVFSAVDIPIWSFLETKDILNLSTCSTLSASAAITESSISMLMKREEKIASVGKFKLAFSSDLTIGMLRRVLNRVHGGGEAIVAVDTASGRVILDVGSAFYQRDAYLAADVTSVPTTAEEDAEEDEASQTIFKHIEVSSCDEYDDFNPRHPMPKDKAHRRGDSYFNSDVELFASEVVGMSSPGGGGSPGGPFDLSNIAQSARELEGAGGGASSLKSRMMSKAKNYTPGKPPLKGGRGVAELTRQDSEEAVAPAAATGADTGNQ